MADEAIQIDHKDNVIIVRVVTDELYGEVANHLLTQVSVATADVDAPRVVLDLSNVTFADSLSLGTLVKTASDLGKKGGKFIVAGAQDAVRRTLALTRMNKLFHIVDTVDEAVAELSGSPEA